MFPAHDLIPIIAILTIFLGVPSIVFYGILRIKRESRSSDAAASMGVRELEERIERAVERANEPLRIQIASLEDRLLEANAQRSVSEPEHAHHLLPGPEAHRS